MGRPLTPFERMLVMMSDGALLNCCVITRVRGPLTEARLTEALSDVQRRHPLLRVRIVDGHSYTEEDVPAIPLRVLDCDEHSTTAAVEWELSVPLPVERGPLVRVSWLRHKSNLGTLVFTFHHVIGDGVSFGVFVRDLIGAAAGTLKLQFRSLDTIAPLEEILPAELRGWRGHWHFLRLFARSLWRAATMGRPLQVRVARWVPPAERTIHVAGRSLNAAFMKALAKKARAEQTGVHGALAAAICMAIAGDRRVTKTTPILFGSTVDMRDHLEPGDGRRVWLLRWLFQLPGADRSVRRSLGSGTPDTNRTGTRQATARAVDNAAPGAPGDEAVGNGTSPDSRSREPIRAGCAGHGRT